MKIKKYLLNIISIILLLLIMVALIIVLTKVNSETSLNAGANNDKENKPTFEYVSAKKSNLSNINFENNFGGSGSETILQVFSLNNHIVIGKTNSNNYYFENKTGSLFVATIDFNGNFKKLVVANENYNFTFVNAIMFNNNIYILINNNGYKVYIYSLIKNTLNKVSEGNQTGIMLTSTSSPILICNDDVFSYAINLASNKTTKIDATISEIVSISPFSEDLLVIFNSNFSFKIAHLTQDSFSIIKNFENCNVINFNINKNNYIFLIKTKTQTEFLILDKSFNVCGDVVTHKNLASDIYNFGTYNTMIFLENNQLTSLEFCLHGDELAINSICDNVISFSSLLVNNEIIVFANLESQINIYKISNHNSIELIDSVLNVGGLNISNISLINNNLTVMGTINQINSIITNCYGSQDMFIFEFAL